MRQSPAQYSLAETLATQQASDQSYAEPAAGGKDVFMLQVHKIEAHAPDWVALMLFAQTADQGHKCLARGGRHNSVV